MEENRSHRQAQLAVQAHFACLVGRRIVSVDALTRAQSVAIGLDEATLGANPVLCMTLDDGAIVVPTADPEGNGPGWLEVVVRRS